MTSGERRAAESGERRAESGERGAESGERRAESGERRAESGERRAESKCKERGRRFDHQTLQLRVIWEDLGVTVRIAKCVRNHTHARAGISCPSCMKFIYHLVYQTIDFLTHFHVSYNLGQNKWNIWTTPPPHFNDAKMARFLLLRAFIIALGGWGIIVPFYIV